MSIGVMMMMMGDLGDAATCHRKIRSGESEVNESSSCLCGNIFLDSWLLGRGETKYDGLR